MIKVCVYKKEGSNVPRIFESINDAISENMSYLSDDDRNFLARLADNDCSLRNIILPIRFGNDKEILMTTYHYEVGNRYIGRVGDYHDVELYIRLMGKKQKEVQVCARIPNCESWAKEDGTVFYTSPKFQIKFKNIEEVLKIAEKVLFENNGNGELVDKSLIASVTGKTSHSPVSK